MTAEIAIINRSAVTLASDSATTIEVRGARKIYTSADKIFESSNTTPLGIMIYNNLEFVGLPLEVAIKHFRDSYGGAPFPKVATAADVFFGFLGKELAPPPDVENEHVRVLLNPVLREVVHSFESAVREEWKRKKNPSKINFTKMFVDAVQAEIARVGAFEVNKSLVEVKPEEIRDRYTEAIDEEIKAIFGDMPLRDSEKNLLRELAILILHRDVFSDASTGLVFAGFGNEELFPSLIAFEIDGVICGKIKSRQLNRVDMSRSELSAGILPFAQREMADRFLDGVDPEFEEGIAAYLQKVLRATGKNLITLRCPRDQEHSDLESGLMIVSDLALSGASARQRAANLAGGT